MNRIFPLIDRPKQPRTAARLICAMGFLVGVFCLVAAARIGPNGQTGGKPDKAGQLRQEAEARYRQWLKEDVAYIITDEERAAFQRLQTNEEREQFIIQFWQRRNPTPQDPGNKFKEEHYRRLAYTNEHFASSVPGWATDRGRIYILYGPPDKVEDSFNLQRWHYRHIDGIGDDIVFEFVHPNYSNEFRLVVPPDKGPVKKQRVSGTA
ncbi:MAG: GWxTD domain-containing protein [Acidobacteriota bacterium]